MRPPQNSRLLPPSAPPPDEVRESVGELVERSPGALSYDPADPDAFLLHIRCQTDPGIPAQLRDGWKGVVRHWACVPYDVTDERTGENVTLPSLVLIDTNDVLIRLTNWPAISSWAAIVRSAGADKCRAGIPVIVRRRQSGTAGRSYWSVQVDHTAFRLQKE